MNITDKIIELSNSLEQHTLEIRRKIHSNPELSFKEFETSKLVCQELDRIGISYEKSPIEPGIIATIDTHRPGKFVMLRADMDALPLQETADLPFASKNANVMHACGHDVHTSNLLAVGEILNATKEMWNGKVKLVFQPAEENGGGGREMIKAGLFDEMPDICLAMHIQNDDGGKIFVGSKNITAYSDACRILIKGKSAHSSLPQQGVDTITIAASIITALNTIVAKNIDPMDNSTLNIGVINGGVAPNIIADKTELICMTRNMTSDARDTMLEKIKTISTGIATAMGGECEVNVRVGYSSVYNDEFLSEFVTKTILQKEKEIFEDIPNVPANYLITKDTAVLGAEDFGFYSQKAPSCLLWMGVGKSAPLHNPEFTVNETYIKVCTRTMALLTAEYLK